MATESPSPVFRVEIAPERLVTLEAEVRAELVAQMMAQTRSVRRELLLSVALVSSEEGALLFRVSPRRFRDLCAEHGVPVEPLGYKTPRYKIALVAGALDAMAVAAGADREAARANIIALAARLTREVEALAA